MKALYMIVKDGGYFHRLHPNLRSTGSIFDHLPEPRIRELHGMFEGKEELKGNYLITLSISAEFSVKDLNINKTDTWNANTTMVIDVPESLYNYNYTPGKNYVITPHDVFPI